MVNEQIIVKLKNDLEKALVRFQEDSSKLRASRPSPALVENIAVECYGSQMLLKEIASIAVSHPNALIVHPWDKSNLQPIEKAILKSDLGVSPVADGDTVRINLPPLTAERREELARTLRRKAEDAKIAFRVHRDEARKKIASFFSEKEISEDEKFKAQEECQKVFDGYQNLLNNFLESREKEILKTD
jgi:ribosome recycling factor